MFKTRNIVIALIIFLVLSFFLQANYFAVKPGTIEDLTEIISVENNTNNNGKFYLVTVAQQPANLVLFFNTIIDPAVDLIPRWQVMPPDMDPEEYNDMMLQWMRDSQNLAKVIALEKVGYSIPVKSDGVKVVDLMEDSPARNILQPGDIILELDGEKGLLAEELVENIQEKQPGESVTVTFKRNDKIFTEAIPTATHPEDENKAGLKIYIRTLRWEPELPVDIEIDTGKIAGPSGGLMFVLEIINQLTSDDISNGKKIAGTGTINLKEEIGPIGGVKQKIAAAEDVGADIFFVPSENIDEARLVARDVQLVEVNSLDEVLNYLKDISLMTPSLTMMRVSFIKMGNVMYVI